MMNEDGELPGVLITGSSNLSYQGLKGRLELNARFNDKQDYEEGIRILMNYGIRLWLLLIKII